MLPIATSQLKALIIDVDGTLYRLGPVRRAMLWRLLRAHVGRPATGILTLRVLWAYRKAQEVLRSRASDDGDIAEAQLRLACEWTGAGPQMVRSYVTRWMDQESLGVVARSLPKGLLEFLQSARRRGLRLGAFSDYPPKAKLVAMSLDHFFDVAVSAQDPEIQKFKPDPRGLEVTLQRLGVEKDEALYIGDRPELDAAAASNAGIACVIIGRRWGALGRPRCVEMSGYTELNHAIFC